MIDDLSTTTTFPDMSPTRDDYYTLDMAYEAAQTYSWSNLFGVLISWAMYACLCIQMYFYRKNYRDDKIFIRYTVWFMFLLETLAVGFLTYTIYVTYIFRWGHDPQWNPATYGPMFFDCSITSIVHLLYGFRLFKLYEKSYLRAPLLGLIGLMSLTQWSCCVATGIIMAFQYHEPLHMQWVARRLFHGWLAVASIADLLVTASMSVKLSTIRSGIKSTDDAIKNILYVAIPAGASTAVIQIMILVIQVVWTGVPFYQFLLISLSHFYANSVLLSLNLRPTRQTLHLVNAYKMMDNDNATLCRMCQRLFSRDGIHLGNLSEGDDGTSNSRSSSFKRLAISRLRRASHDSHLRSPPPPLSPTYNDASPSQTDSKLPCLPPLSHSYDLERRIDSIDPAPKYCSKDHDIEA